MVQVICPTNSFLCDQLRFEDANRNPNYLCQQSKCYEHCRLRTLDYPPLTADLEEAKAHLDEYGMALIENVLTAKEVEEMDQRLNEQFLGEEKHQVGSKLRGDEGLGVQSPEEE